MLDMVTEKGHVGNGGEEESGRSRFPEIERKRSTKATTLEEAIGISLFIAKPLQCPQREGHVLLPRGGRISSS